MFRWLFRRWIRAGAEEAERVLGPGNVVISDDFAQFFGVESAGATQLRGNGFLGASERELVFVMWVPRRTIRIPRSSITGVNTPWSFLGKTVAQKLLAVSFTNDIGQQDSAGWLVRDLASWEAALAT